MTDTKAPPGNLKNTRTCKRNGHIRFQIPVHEINKQMIKERFKNYYKSCYYIKLMTVILALKGTFGRSCSSRQCRSSDMSDVSPVHALVLLVSDSSDVPTDRQHGSRE